jgi:hypothetical protein
MVSLYAKMIFVFVLRVKAKCEDVTMRRLAHAWSPSAAK